MKNKGKNLSIVLAIIIVLFTFLGTTNLLCAESFPSKPIELIITVNPGSAADVFARILAKATEDATGSKIVCKNKPGGGHAIAISYVLSQPADGYTIFGQTDTLAFGLATGKLPFTGGDLAPIAMATIDPNLLVVNSESNIYSVDDFIKAAKEKPGKLKVGGVGTHSAFHSLADEIDAQAGTKLTWVPYAGGSKVKMAILGNNIDACIISSGNVRAHIKKGKLRALGIFTTERDQYMLKDVPTFKELGYDIANIHWRGILTKKGVPLERLDKLASMFKQGVQTPRWKEYLAKHEQTGDFRERDEFTNIFLEGVKDAKAWVDQNK